MNFSTASEQLARGRNGQKKIANNTYLHEVENGIAIRLHSTDIVTIKPDGTFTLETGGWQSRTTKERINEFTPAGLYQKKGLWYMSDGSVFRDGIIIDETGKVLNPVEDNTVEKKKELDKMVNKYIKDFASDAIDNGLKMPSSGDCFCCQFSFDDVDHLFSHIEESYFVPSLLLNAIKSSKYRNPGLIYTLAVNDAKNGKSDFITMNLRYYFYKMKPKMLATMIG